MSGGKPATAGGGFVGIGIPDNPPFYSLRPLSKGNERSAFYGTCPWAVKGLSSAVLGGDWRAVTGVKNREALPGFKQCPCRGALCASAVVGLCLPLKGGGTEVAEGVRFS